MLAEMFKLIDCKCALWTSSDSWACLCMTLLGCLGSFWPHDFSHSTRVLKMSSPDTQRPPLNNALSRVFSRVRLVKVPKDAPPKNEEKPASETMQEDEPVSFFLLFKTADFLDNLAIAGALTGSVAAGALLPSFSILFGEFTNAFGNPNAEAFMTVIKDLSLKFLYLGIGAGVADFMSNCLWTWSGNRQANRIRAMYLSSVIHQEIAFFDTSKTGTGGLLQGLNQDAADIQTAISEKLGVMIKSFTTFIVGFILAFIKGWSMTLVMLGCIPLMGLMGAFMAKTIGSSTQRQNAAYAKASMVAQQAISQIRTVVSYTQEARMEKEYGAALLEPMAAGIHQAWVMGLTFGGMNLPISFPSFFLFLSPSLPPSLPPFSLPPSLPPEQSRTVISLSVSAL